MSSTSINISNNLLVICSGNGIYLFKRQNDLINFTSISPFEIKIDDYLNEKDNKKNKKDEENEILCSALSINFKRLAVCTSSKFLLIFNLNNDELLSSNPFICELIKAPTKISFLTNETVLLSNRSGSLYKFEIKESEISQGIELIGHFSMLLDFCVSPNGKFVLTADRDEKIRVSRYPQTFVIEGFCFGHLSFVKSICCIDNTRAISAGGDSIIYLWDYTLFKCISTSEKIAETPIRKIGVIELDECNSNNNRIIVLPDESNSILLYSINEDQKITKLCFFTCSNEDEYLVDFCVDIDRKNVVYCVGKQNIYYFQTINLPSSCDKSKELKQIIINPINSLLLQQLNLTKELLPLKTLYKIPLNGKNIEDYKNRKEERLNDKKKKKIEEFI